MRQHGQRGAAALLVTTLLVVIGGLGALVVNEAMVTEQKITGSNLRNKEAYAAAISGLDYAIEWLENTGATGITWDPAPGAPGSTAEPTALTDSAEGVDSYVHTLSYELLTDISADPKLMRVTSTARALADSHVEKTVSVIVIRAALISGAAYKGPPLLVEECVSNVQGTPNIVPNDLHDPKLAIGSVKGNGMPIEDCLDPGHFNLTGGSAAKLDPSGPDLFSTVFGVGRDESDIQSWAAANPANIIYVDSNYAGPYSFNGNKWGVSLGSATNDVILYFDDSVGCPKINGGGGVVIYGLVYFEQEDCDSQGWGAATIHGTVAFSGDLAKFTANTELIGDALDSFGGDNSTFSVVSIVPGSWRDF